MLSRRNMARFHPVDVLGIPCGWTGIDIQTNNPCFPRSSVFMSDFPYRVNLPTLHLESFGRNICSFCRFSSTDPWKDRMSMNVVFSPPARWGLFRVVLLLLLLLLLLFLLLLLHHPCLHFHVHFRLANSSLISSPTSARSGHCWTSTAGFRSEWARLDLNRKVLSAVGTAGPQPGTFRAQWAPLDLNLGPSELSGHRWTSAARWNARIYSR